MPASTSETAARLESSIGVSIFSDTTAFIGRSLFRGDDASAECPPHDERLSAPMIPPILTTSRPVCGNARPIPGHACPGRGAAFFTLLRRPGPYRTLRLVTAPLCSAPLREGLRAALHPG